MNKKNIIGILVVTIVVLFSIFAIVLVINQNSDKKQKKQLYNNIYDKFQLIVDGNILESNMNFIDNYENSQINKMYLNLSKDELLKNGYVEYIQGTDYMVEFYKKISVDNIEIIKNTENTIEIKVYVKRPNLLKVMNECDSENIYNPNYNFNKTFIDKMNNNDFDYEEGSYNIILHKVEDDIKFEYTEEFKNMLYSENE